MAGEKWIILLMLILNVCIFENSITINVDYDYCKDNT